MFISNIFELVIEKSIETTAEYAVAIARCVPLPSDPGAIYRNFTNLPTELRALRTQRALLLYP